MPRITKAEVAAAIAARPFDPSHAADAAEAYGNLSDGMRFAVAAAIAKDRASGLSGHDLRVRYGGESKSHGAPRDTGLTGPKRREVLREHELANASTIARSYDAYGDGTPRAGSAHARNYGANAAERQAEAIRQAEAAEEKAAKAAERKAKAAARKAAKAEAEAANAEA